MSQPSATSSIVPEQELAPAAAMAGRILEQLDRMLLGRPQLHRLVLAGILSRGHILLEGLPGVGKTALVQALGQLLRLEFNRVQFTPDLMPSDILGSHILQQESDGERRMAFHPGPVFTNILLADEIRPETSRQARKKDLNSAAEATCGTGASICSTGSTAD